MIHFAKNPYMCGHDFSKVARTDIRKDLRSKLEFIESHIFIFIFVLRQISI